MNDREWLIDLPFFCNITDKLNTLNVELVGKDETTNHVN